MNRMIRVLAIAAAALCAAGCVSSRPAPAPAPDKRMLREVADAALRNLLVSPQFCLYVERFRARHEERNPAMKLASEVNDANDTDPNLAIIYRMLAEDLAASGKVEISKYQPCRITFAPDVSPDEMEKAREEICGRYPDILLRIGVSTEKETVGHGLQSKSHRFGFSMYEVASGNLIWQFRKTTGLVRTCW